jgi:uncharacterized protein (DUF486 family)
LLLRSTHCQRILLIYSNVFMTFARAVSFALLIAAVVVALVRLNPGIGSTPPGS